MAALTEIDKQGKFIAFKKDGQFLKQEIRNEDVVVSFPPAGFSKVTNIYVEPGTGKLVAIYEE